MAAFERLTRPSLNFARIQRLRVANVRPRLRRNNSVIYLLLHLHHVILNSLVSPYTISIVESFKTMERKRLA